MVLAYKGEVMGAQFCFLHRIVNDTLAIKLAAHHDGEITLAEEVQIVFIKQFRLLNDLMEGKSAHVIVVIPLDKTKHPGHRPLHDIHVLLGHVARQNLNRILGQNIVTIDRGDIIACRMAVSCPARHCRTGILLADILDAAITGCPLLSNFRATVG